MKTDRELTVVFAAHTFIGAPFVVGSHHLARETARRGHRVLHVSTPITAAHLLRLRQAENRNRFANWRRGGTRLEHGLVDYVPLTLWPWQLAGRFLGPGRNPFLRCIPSLGSFLTRSGFRNADLLFVDQPRFAGLETVLDSDVVIYRPTDVYTEFYRDRGTDAAERLIARRAHGLVATSGPVMERLKVLEPNKPALLLENGVEYEHFARPAVVPPEYASIPSPRLVYIGALDERFDFAAVAGLAQRLPSVRIVLIGPRPPEARALAGVAPNIDFLGARPYASLPGYLQHADAGLLPLNDHPANAGRSPMKLYEYAAAGLPVVARQTPELSRRKEPFVAFYRHHDELPALVSRILNAKPDRAEIQARAQAWSWTARTEALLRFALGSKPRGEES